MPKRKHLSSSKELKRPPDSIGILLNKRYVCVCVYYFTNSTKCTTCFR